MARPPISLTTRGLQTFTSGGSSNSFLVDAYTVLESTSGSSGHKDLSGWVNPTDYSVSANYRHGAVGIVENVHPVNGLAYRYTGVVGPTNNTAPVNLGAYFNSCLSESDCLNFGSLANQAKIKALSNLKRKKVDLGVAFAEANRTARLVGDTAIRIARCVSELKHGRVRNAMQWIGLRSASGAPRGHSWPANWLELQYGWKPLLSEINGAVLAIKERNIYDFRVTVKGTVSETLSGNFRVTPSGSSPTGYDCTAGGQRGAMCRIDAIPGNEFLKTLSTVGLTNPLVVAWEVVPYSFVVDWFWDIGGWLNSLDAGVGWSGTTSSTSLMSRADWQLNGVSGTLSNGSRITNNYTGTKHLFRLIRTTEGLPDIRVPSFKNPWSFGHMANGLSLLAQVFGR